MNMKEQRYAYSGTSNSIITRKTILGISLVIILFLLFPPAPGIARETGQGTTEPLEIEIETTVEDTPLQKFTVTESVITENEIKKLPVRNLPELLGTIPGLISYGRGSRSGRSDISIRGFGFNYMKVCLDGVPLNNANDRAVDFNLIPLEIIERVEIIKGPAPVTYGSDSVGGIINIITKRGHSRQPSSLKLTAGNFGTLEAGTLISTGNDKTGFLAYAGHRRTAGWAPNTRSSFTDFFAKLSTALAAGTDFIFSLISTSGERQVVNQENLDGSLRKRITGFWTGTYNLEYPLVEQRMLTTAVEKKSETSLGYQVRVYYKQYNDTLRGYVDAQDPVRPPAGSPFAYYEAGRFNYSYWNSHTYGGDARITLPAGNHHFTLGSSFDRPSFRDTYLGRNNPADPPGSLSLPKELWTQDFMNPWTSLTYGSIYLQDEIKMGKDFTLTLGLRNDSFSRAPSALYGVANLVYRRDNSFWRFSAARTGRFPTLAELEGRGGNPDLMPERGRTFELGYRYQSPDDLSFEAAVYRSSIDNLIIPSDPLDPFSQKVNIGKFESAGGEVSLSKRWSSLTGRIGYAYNNRVYGDLVTRLWEPTPRHQAVGELRWEKENSLCWSIQALMLGSRRTPELEVPRLPGYTLVNVALAYPNFTASSKETPWQAELKVTNLFNTRYQNRPYSPEPGRWVTASVKLNF